MRVPCSSSHVCVDPSPLGTARSWCVRGRGVPEFSERHSERQSCGLFNISDKNKS
jgi:hypothetical protein